MTLISIHVPVLGTPDAARARARRPRSPRARCAAVAPRAHQAVTGARHRLGVAYAARPPLRDAGQDVRRQPPGGMLVGSAQPVSLRGSTRPGPLLSLAALALIEAVTGARHRLCKLLRAVAQHRCRAVWPLGQTGQRYRPTPSLLRCEPRARARAAARRFHVGTTRPCLPAAPRPREPA